MTWNPIEAAPKDGSYILLYFPKMPPWAQVSVGSWEPQEHAAKPRPYWTSQHERIWGIPTLRERQPTHWQPLPPPPEAAP